MNNSLHSVPVNAERKPLDMDNPNGSSDMTALQKHVAFFDRNNDGIVYPWETYEGFRAIGFGKPISLLASVAINAKLSYSTLPSRVPDLRFPIYVKNIHKAKHGSDSQVYNTEGKFDAEKFDAIFSKYAISHGDALTHEELDAMLKGNRVPNDESGWKASEAEWSFLYKLAKDENGLLHKDAVRGVYDGSLFEYMEKKNSPHRPL